MIRRSRGRWAFAGLAVEAALQVNVSYLLKYGECVVGGLSLSTLPERLCSVKLISGDISQRSAGSQVSVSYCPPRISLTLFSLPTQRASLLSSSWRLPPSLKFYA